MRKGFEPEALHTYTDQMARRFTGALTQAADDGEKFIRPMQVRGMVYAMAEPEFAEGKPLYRLHELAARRDDVVIVTEGEHKADKLAALGLLVTTSGAADSAVKANWQPLAMRDVMIWPDNDEAGRRYADAAAAILCELGCTVRTIDVSLLRLEAKGDSVDWLKSNPEATAADVLALACEQGHGNEPQRSETDTVVSVFAAESVASAGRAAEPSLIDAPQPLPPELLPVDAFPMAALPEAFGPWVQDVAERMHCPPDFVAVPLLVAGASLVARHVGIRPQRQTDWIERANLWALIVGRPGIMKSPAMSQALLPMERLEARAAEKFNAQAAQHQAEALAAKLRAETNVKAARSALKKNSGADVATLLNAEDEPDEPIRRRYVVNDLTYEKLGVILAANPDGVLSVRDEMRGLFLSLGREESAPARAFYLQAWSGGRYTFDRIERGTVTVEDARISIIGGIQPGPLSELVQQARRGAADDGMIERFLIAWPDAPGKWREVDRWPDTEGKRRLWQTFERLDALTAAALSAQRENDTDGVPHGLPFVRFDDDAREAFGEWRSEFEGTIRTAEGEGLEGALSKFRHHVPALALALHVIDGGTGAVALPATLRALTLAEYFESHARRLHSSGRRVTVRAARTIIDKARAGALPDPFTARDVYRNEWSGLSDKAAAADALDMLSAYGWLTEATVETGGRPTTAFNLTQGARRG